MSILGFNLGIEVVQLLVVVSVMPSLLMLARTRLYSFFRSFCAVLAGVAAMAWGVERVSERANPVASGVDLVLGNAGYIVVVLTILAAFMVLLPRVRMAQRRGA